MKATGILYLGVFAFFVLGLAGCGQPMGSAIGVSAGISEEDKKFGLDQVDTEAARVEQSFEKSLNVLDLIGGDQGLGFGIGDVSGGGDDFLGNVEDAFADAMMKLADGLRKVRDRIEEARQKIQDRLDELDATNPLHQAAIVKLQDVLNRMENLEIRFDVGIERLRERFDRLLSAIDRFTNKLEIDNPLHLIVLYKVNQFKQGLKRGFNAAMDTI